MASVRCPCGRSLSDNTDHIDYKARIVADQDYGYLLSYMGRGEELPDQCLDYFRTIFHCPDCGRLILDNSDQYLTFTPEQALTPNLFWSVLGKKWKGTLGANFYIYSRGGEERPVGEVFWHTNGDSGFRQNLSKEEVLVLYHQKFEELRGRNTLAESFLRVEGESLHRYGIDD